MLKVGVVGLGNWGTALANHLANKGYDVLGWATNKEVVKSIINIPDTIWKKKRIKAFTDFNRKFICFYKEVLSESDNNEWIDDKFDLFIAGSDQIWNPNSPFVNKNFFMQFASKSKRSTYAASFVVIFLQRKRRVYRVLIDETEFLSVRELRAVSMIEN